MRQGRHEALARAAVIGAAALLAAVTVYAGARTMRARRKRLRPVFDYSGRSGFPRAASEMRGAARRQPARALTP